MKQLIKIGLCLIFSTCTSSVLFAQVTDALVISPEGNIQVPGGNLDVKGNITTTGNVITNGKLMENGNALLPKGVIMMWYGEEKDVPKGWTICNGQNDTPDLRGRFIVGAGPNGENTYYPRDNGGRDMQTLTTDQMPSHSHRVRSYSNSKLMSSSAEQRDKDSGIGATHSLYDTGSDKSIRTVEGDLWLESSGGGRQLDNRPKYYALCYIMKL